MKRLLLGGIIWAAAATAGWADEGQFSQVVKPEDFAAAGLSKLSPAEMARLDQLGSDYRSGALEAARRQAAAADERARLAEADARTAQEAAETRAIQAEAAARVAQAAQVARAARAADRERQEAAAEAAEQKKASGGFFSRARALVAPGTKVEYQPVESRIVGRLNGWGPQSIFLLENGQCWKVANNDTYYNGTVLVNPKVTIRHVPTFGGFQMYIQDVGTVRVRLVGELPPLSSP